MRNISPLPSVREPYGTAPADARKAYTPIPITSLDSSDLSLSNSRSQSVKFWDLARIMDLRSSHRPKPVTLKPGRQERISTEVAEFVKLLQTEGRKRSPRKSQEMRAKPKLRAALRNPSRLSPSPPLHITLHPSTEPSRRPRFPAKFMKKKPFAILQPLRMTGYKGSSDPCFHVVNYAGNEPTVTAGDPPARIASTESVRPMEPPPAVSECIGSCMKLVLPLPPRQPQRYSRPRKLQEKAFWRLTRLEGWDTSPRDFSPLGDD